MLVLFTSCTFFFSLWFGLLICSKKYQRSFIQAELTLSVSIILKPIWCMTIGITRRNVKGKWDTGKRVAFHGSFILLTRKNPFQCEFWSSRVLFYWQMWLYVLSSLVNSAHCCIFSQVGKSTLSPDKDKFTPLIICKEHKSIKSILKS